MITGEIFKANDIRGVVGSQWDVAGARALGQAFAEELHLGGRRFVIGRDMRASGPELCAAFIEGAQRAGATALDTGLASTDQIWFASGSMDLPGVQFSASHNPARYNGIKFCLAGAAPVPTDFLPRLARRAMAIDAPNPQPENPEPEHPAPETTETGTTAPETTETGTTETGTTETGTTKAGGCEQIDTLPDYVAHLRRLVDLRDIEPLRVVVDAGNGMAGHTVHAVFAGLPIEVIGMYLDLDGTFPNHEPNPLDLANLVDAQQCVRDHRADAALVFDGDADRCFIIDEQGQVVSPSAITALIAAAELEREPGGVVVINTITSRSVADVVAAHGGRTVVSKVGHTFVKAAMAEHDAIFGGEHSGHYYFRDFWRADTGMLAALQVLQLMGRSGLPLSALMAQYQHYAASPERNFEVRDAPAVMGQVAARFEQRATGIDQTDGLTIDLPDNTWFNLRPSNTEPFLRLNVEAPTSEQVQQLSDEVVEIITTCQHAPTKE